MDAIATLSCSSSCSSSPVERYPLSEDDDCTCVATVVGEHALLELPRPPPVLVHVPSVHAADGALASRVVGSPVGRATRTVSDHFGASSAPAAGYRPLVSVSSGMVTESTPGSLFHYAPFSRTTSSSRLPPHAAKLTMAAIAIISDLPGHTTDKTMAMVIHDSVICRGEIPVVIDYALKLICGKSCEDDTVSNATFNACVRRCDLLVVYAVACSNVTTRLFPFRDVAYATNTPLVVRDMSALKLHCGELE
jgi:hypothetical protein